MVQDVSTSLGVLKLRKERNFALQFCLEFDQNLLVHSVKGCSSRFRLFWKENYALLLEEEEQLSKPTSKGLFTCSQVLLTLWEQFNTTTASTAVTRLWGLSSLATKDILKSLWAFFMPKKAVQKYRPSEFRTTNSFLPTAVESVRTLINILNHVKIKVLWLLWHLIKYVVSVKKVRGLFSSLTRAQQFIEAHEYQIKFPSFFRLGVP